MAIKKLIEVWDGEKLLKDNITFLKKTTKEVHLPLSDNNQNILDDLLDTFKNTPCAGVAANQIGYDKRIFIGLKHDDYGDEMKKTRKKKSLETLMLIIMNFILIHK